MAILFLNNSELKESTFRSRLINFEGRDISTDVFSLLVKNNLGTVIKTIVPTVQGNAVLFQLTELEALSSSTYNMEYWGNFAGLGKEMIIYETLVITKIPNDAQKNKNITISATVEIEDVVINLAISNPVVQVIGEGGEGSGANGKSAYEIAVLNGFTGTEAEWLISLKGADGDDFTYEDFTPEQLALLKGADGKSAYQIALDNGFVGTEAEWLASLQGSGGGGTAPATTFIPSDNTNASTMKATSDYFTYQKVLEEEKEIITTNSFILDTGMTSAHASWRTSQLIPVLESQTYLYFGRTNTGNASAVAGYNEAGTFVTMILGKGLLGTNGLPFTIPAGVSQIRISSFADTPLKLKKTGLATKIKDELLPSIYSSLKGMGKSWGVIGHSIWENDRIPNLVKKIFYFTDYANYAYSANSLAGTGTNSVLHPSKSDLWTSKDIYTLDTITNDFKLNRPIGTQDDFLNNTGQSTYYGALRVLHEKLKTLNPKYIMICANATKRNDTTYTSWNTNALGFNLTDYSNALEWVANRLSWRFINQFRDSGISDDNLYLFTTDGLHYNADGDKMVADLWVAEFEKIYKRTFF